MSKKLLCTLLVAVMIVATALTGCGGTNELSDDETVYTFHLREDAKWSDGQPVTAHDFEYAWKRVCNADTAATYAFIMTPYIKGAQEYYDGTGSADDVGIKALDDYTLEVQLNFPVAYFLNLTSFYTYMPVRQDCVETGDGWEKDPETCISNGPFKLEEYKSDLHIILTKNEEYWNSHIEAENTLKRAEGEYSQNKKVWDKAKKKAVKEAMNQLKRIVVKCKPEKMNADLAHQLDELRINLENVLNN